MTTNFLFGLAALGAAIGAAASSTPAPAPDAGPDPCELQADEALVSCRREAASDYWLARAKCTNLADPLERQNCLRSARIDYEDAWDECDEINEARVELCLDLGGGYYDPAVDPNDFVDTIDNPYLPWIPGTSWQYKSSGGEEDETIDIFVLSETVEILGVECTAVLDVVTDEDGVLIEDTTDWFAQDVWGNVWYFGEISFNYEDGEVSDIEGSWKAGEDGALPGIVMHANPVLDQVYRQEMLLREAEDVGVMLSLTESVTVPYGSFTNCRMSEDYTPLEPDSVERKYYAAGVGFVLETKPETGEKVELVQMTMP